MPADRGVGADDFAEARAIDVGHAGQVEDDFLVTLVDETVDLVLEQLVAFAQGYLPLQVQHHYVAHHPFVDLHGNTPDICDVSLTHPDYD